MVPEEPNVCELLDVVLYLSPETPLVPVKPDVPLTPELPELPEVPDEPVIPDVPLVPLIPEEPLSPDEPDVPEPPPPAKELKSTGTGSPSTVVNVKILVSGSKSAATNSAPVPPPPPDPEIFLHNLVAVPSIVIISANSPSVISYTNCVCVSKQRYKDVTFDTVLYANCPALKSFTDHSTISRNCMFASNSLCVSGLESAALNTKFDIYL